MERDSFLSYTCRLTAEKEQSARDARAAADDARLARDEVEATRKTLALEREWVKLMQKQYEQERAERECTYRDLLRQQVAAEKLPMSRAPEVKQEPGSSMLEQAVT